MTKVLIVDGNEDNIAIARMILEKDSYQIITATTGREALDKALTDRPDVVLLDSKLPDLDGFEVCRRMKAVSAGEQASVLFLSSEHRDIDSVVEGLDAGAEAYIVKPYSSPELRARVKVLARLHGNMAELTKKNEELASTNQILETTNTQLADAKQELEQLAITDPLTGLYNRRYFDERMLEGFALASREKVTIHFLLFDLDFFKKVNDNHGHHIGDAVLVQFSNILRRQTRKNDIVARIGGEEFSVAMFNIPATQAHRAAERIRAEVEKSPFGDDTATLSITCSVGLASHPEIKMKPPTPEALMQHADLALYYAKDHGRNQVVIAPAPKK